MPRSLRFLRQNRPSMSTSFRGQRTISRDRETSILNETAYFVHPSSPLLSICRRRSTLGVALILGDTVVSKAIINCPVNYTPSRNDVHMLPKPLPPPPPCCRDRVPGPWHDRNELFNYHDLSPAVSLQSIMHDRSCLDFRFSRQPFANAPNRTTRTPCIHLTVTLRPNILSFPFPFPDFAPPITPISSVLRGEARDRGPIRKKRKSTRVCVYIYRKRKMGRKISRGGGKNFCSCCCGARSLRSFKGSIRALYTDVKYFSDEGEGID